MTTPTPPQSPSPQSLVRIGTIMRIAGVVLIIVGTLAVLDAGGLASLIGFTDPVTQKTLGGLLIFMGLIDFFVMPRVFEKMAGSRDKAL